MQTEPRQGNGDMTEVVLRTQHGNSSADEQYLQQRLSGTTWLLSVSWSIKVMIIFRNVDC